MVSQKITDLDAKEAKRFFLKEKSYVNFELPYYFHFEQLIQFVAAAIGKKQLHDICKKDAKGKRILPSAYDNVSYTILSNKDGAYSWRPLQIIHPVLYIDIVNLITEEANWKQIIDRFKVFEKASVKCISIPRE